MRRHMNHSHKKALRHVRSRQTSEASQDSALETSRAGPGCPHPLCPSEGPLEGTQPSRRFVSDTKAQMLT